MSNIASNKLGNNGGRAYSFLNQPVTIDCSFVVDSSNGNGLGIRALKGSGVQAVYMYTSATPAAGNPMGQAASEGLALIQLSNNYSRYCGGFSGLVSPLSGSNLAINSTALTIGSPYVITSVGHAAAGTVTIAPLANVTAGAYFTIYDGYGQTFALWFQVAGVGTAPQLSGVISVPVSVAASASADAQTTALSTVINALPSPISGVYSFTATGGGTATLTVVSTQTNPYGPLPGAPADGTIATGATFAVTKYNTNLQNWQAVGLPAGVVPNVGASFIATATGASTGGGSTGQVQLPLISGISSLEVIGDPNTSFAPIPMGGSPNVGGWIMVQFLAPTSSSTTTLIPTVPTNGSVVGMTFMVEARSITIAGE